MATLQKEEKSRAVTGMIPNCRAKAFISVRVFGQIHEDGTEAPLSVSRQVAGSELPF